MFAAGIGIFGIFKTQIAYDMKSLLTSILLVFIFVLQSSEVLSQADSSSEKKKIYVFKIDVNSETFLVLLF